MTRRTLGQLPTSILTGFRKMVQDTVDKTLKQWGNPTLSREDEEALILLSFISVATTTDPLKWVEESERGIAIGDWFEREG